MLRRSVWILAALSLAAFAGTASAANFFFDMSVTAGNLQAWPTGISPTAGVIMDAQAPAQANLLYTPYAFPAGAAGGTMTNIESNFVSSAGTVWRAVSSCMSNNGNVTINQTSFGQQAWAVTGNMSSYSYFEFPGATETRSDCINNNGDVGGTYTPGKYTSGKMMNAFIYSGGTSYFMDVPAGVPSGMGDCVTAMNTNGQAVGNNLAGAPPLPGDFSNATLWTKTGSTWASYTATSLQTTTLANMYPGLSASDALAINSSGVVVLGVNTAEQTYTSPLDDNAYCLYNTGTGQYTPLTQGSTNLMMYDPIAGSIGYDGGHEQCINDSGAVVGYTGTQGSTWQAAIWQNGTITNLNTLYAGILPAGFVLNNATAIDNRGDIVGYGTDASSNTYQAFEILNLHAGDANGDGKVDINDLTIVLANYNQSGKTWAQGAMDGDPTGTVDINDLTIVLSNYNTTSGASAGGMAAVPEPCALALLAAGLAGLAAYAWRKRR